MPQYFLKGSTISKLHSDSSDSKATRWCTSTRCWAGLVSEGLEERELEPSSGLHDMRGVSVICRISQFSDEQGKGKRKKNFKPEF